ncbi:uncharacterized protein PHACADRAFT_258889 [Phanerochaete carnosa HHB-10118-sp]|uniref:Deoxyuridine 5'-triphosphate nucleotidohydrolase n=1 Tax=Phanerochaete carnosa (strain HHB-10118-sp) TaxID=650164 RepID=K5W6P5_PHACS|nr:uncharacterized protein PHACADRAFT_258889 [Phanerochaete carnosa HHB-10118-sp]EKM54790.1 hypothetical protein PHACADRAFT_258889 [Phanerochaete carnosa HHB-10118-sp]
MRAPHGTYARIAPRSGLAVKGIDIGVGVVDRDYTREVRVVMINTTDQIFQVHAGDRIAQVILERIASCDIEEDPGSYDDDLGKAVLRMPNASEGVLSESWRSGDREYKVHKRKISIMGKLLRARQGGTLCTWYACGYATKSWAR